MCGIAGFFHTDGAPGSPVRLKAMCDAIAHRGPDGEGQFVDGSVGLGHRRLAIIDLSPLGRQPMSTPDGRYTLTYNGELYNYHYYRPGLVGGHCVGVDPYYLTHKAQSLGFHPEMILAGRRINDGMATYVAQDIIKHMLRKKLRVDSARILIMGITFKQNCPDVRNTKIADLVAELTDFGHQVTVYDPIADREEVRRNYPIRLADGLPDGGYDAVVFAVRHDSFAKMSEAEVHKLVVPGGLIYDMKGVLPLHASDARL